MQIYNAHKVKHVWIGALEALISCQIASWSILTVTELAMTLETV